MITLRVKAGMAAASALTTIKLLASRHSGDHRLVILIEHAKGERRLELGELWGYDGSPLCLAALGEFGEVAVS